MLGVFLHMFNLNLLDEYRDYIANIAKAGHSFDLYIAIPQDVQPERVQQLWPQAMIVPYENRGFDIASFLDLTAIAFKRKPYTYILKLHSKSDERWRKELILPVCGSPAAVNRCLDAFKNEQVGMVGAGKWLMRMGRKWGIYAEHIEAIGRLWSVDVTDCSFIGGTVFWLRASILQAALAKVDLRRVIASLNTETSLDHHWYLLNYTDLVRNGIDTEAKALTHWLEFGRAEKRACNVIYARKHGIKIRIDGMVEHAYERFFGLLVRQSGRIISAV